MDTATAHPQPLTSARLQPEDPGITNEEAQQQLHREPGRRKLCLTQKGQGASSESPHVTKVPKPMVGSYRSACHPISGSVPPLSTVMPGREIRLLPNAGPRARRTVRPNKTDRSEFGAEKGSGPGRLAPSEMMAGQGLGA